MRQPCKKCLIADLDYDEYTENIAQYIKKVPEDMRVPDEEYQRRLDLCRRCEELANGICAKCGCFVELRALKIRSRCPHEKRVW